MTARIIIKGLCEDEGQWVTIGGNHVLIKGSTKITLSPYPTKSGKYIGGHAQLSDKSKVVGGAHMQLTHADTTFPLSGRVPANTGVIDSIDINDEEQGKGYGTHLLKSLEKNAQEHGMTQMYATHVMDGAEPWWTKQGYSATGQGRIWSKPLVPAK